jgi:hypothetical protein
MSHKLLFYTHSTEKNSQSTYVSLGVGPQFFKNVGATSKIYAPQGWIEATGISKTPQY